MNTTINLRIDDGLKDALTEMADQRNLKLSKFAREILMEYVKNPDSIDDVQNIKDSKDLSTTSDREKNQDSQGFRDPDAHVNFLQMILWIHDRRAQPLFNNSREFLLSIKGQVDIAILDSPFSPHLKMEFMKIQTDLNSVLREPDGYNKRFAFASCGVSGFNYELLSNELKNL